MNNSDINRQPRWEGDYHPWSRRHYLVATVGIAALSGCTGGSDDDDSEPEPSDGEDDDSSDDGDEEEELPDGVSQEQFDQGPVPEMYATATSLGNEQRDPDDLFAKADVGFTEYDDAGDASGFQPGHCCANCADFIPDKNGDAFGACTEVEGYIDGADWCSVYESLPEPEVPAGLTEGELATAEVPRAYRTAGSIGGEVRDPNDLFTQEQVSVAESVEAIAEGAAAPGQSCGNCAEFIPDKNGDTWGACAKVEGYLAAEDWCTVWEHVTEEL
ncbi:high-potential iron-sulfur protein [Halorubrum halophilum]|uniref:high-potential iron-sulfur protein n=1 Tax=Halorubrum halophilum TaxID=413816 RepID=UPI00186AE1C8|nr:high-potential iron-sulfur protein [Halorubrum halophilum]